MDTIIFVVTVVGANLAIALIFVSTVLSFKWWKLNTNHRHQKENRKNISEVQVYLDANRILSSLNPVSKTINFEKQTWSKSKARILQLKGISRLSDLVNKKVKTCEMADVGHVVSIDKQSMTILHDTGQKYAIST